MTLVTKQKPKTCRGCKSAFMPVRPTQVVCGLMCGLEVGRKKRLVQEAKAKREEKRADAPRKAALKTIAELIAEAQVPFNRYINLRDAGKPCICCGKPMERDAYGNPKVNAGHWRSRGAAGHLRFDEANCHSQRVSCNRPGGARPGPFREGMIARVGLAEVERLEADNRPEKWQREELIEIKQTYVAKARELKKAES